VAAAELLVLTSAVAVVVALSMRQSWQIRVSQVIRTPSQSGQLELLAVRHQQPVGRVEIAHSAVPEQQLSLRMEVAAVQLVTVPAPAVRLGLAAETVFTIMVEPVPMELVLLAMTAAVAVDLEGRVAPVLLPPASLAQLLLPEAVLAVMVAQAPLVLRQQVDLAAVAVVPVIIRVLLPVVPGLLARLPLPGFQPLHLALQAQSCKPSNGQPSTENGAARCLSTQSRSTSSSSSMA
jgi:hypothetical protein